MDNKYILEKLKEGAKPNVAQLLNMTQKDLTRALETDAGLKNDFINDLINKVGKMIIESHVYESKLTAFYKGEMPFGETIETIFIDYASAKLIDDNFAGSKGDEHDLVSTNVPSNFAVLAANSATYEAKASISDARLRAAIYQPDGLARLVQGLMDSIVSAINLNIEMLVQKEINDSIKNIIMPKVDAMPLNQKSADGVLIGAQRLGITIRHIAGRMTTARNDLNIRKVLTNTRKEDLVFVTTPEVLAMLNTEDLSFALGTSMEGLMPRVVLIDEFSPTVAKLNVDGTQVTTESRVVYGLLCDKNFIQHYNIFSTMKNFENPDTLSRNVFMQRRDAFGISPFANGVLILKGTDTSADYLPEGI